MAATLNASGIVYSDGTVTYSSTTNGVGSYALAKLVGSLGTYNYGSTIAGSSLKPCNAGGDIGSSSALAGSWRCMGRAINGYTSIELVSIWVRYA